MSHDTRTELRALTQLLSMPCHGMDDERQLLGTLKQTGYKQIGRGATRRVYARPGSHLVIKYGPPDDNLDEWEVTQDALHPQNRGREHNLSGLIIPAVWVSPHGDFLIMARAECTLKEACDRHEPEQSDWWMEDERDMALQNLMDHGFRDVHPANVGLWQGTWRMLDYTR